MAAMSRFKRRERGVQVDTSRTGGGGQHGCLSLIICQVVSLFGATPSEIRVHMTCFPIHTSVTAYCMVLFGFD